MGSVFIDTLIPPQGIPEFITPDPYYMYILGYIPFLILTLKVYPDISTPDLYSRYTWRYPLLVHTLQVYLDISLPDLYSRYTWKYPLLIPTPGIPGYILPWSLLQVYLEISPPDLYSRYTWIYPLLIPTPGIPGDIPRDSYFFPLYSVLPSKPGKYSTFRIKRMITVQTLIQFLSK